MIGPGCEPTWFSSGDKLAWVTGKKAKERSGIGMYEIKSKKVSDLQDADAPRGHEYFPKLASADRFLLYSSARPGEHDANTANYQLFIKDLSNETVVRVTFDEHTNRWPKLLP